jgi:SNF2 family DNA or RNA helicase
MSATQSNNSTLSYANITEVQQSAIDALYAGNKLVIAPVGFGKAVVGQTAAQELIADGVLKRVLVIAPLKVANLTWAPEYLKWDHLHRVGIATGAPQLRREALLGDFDIVVVNIENVAWMVKEGLHTGFDGLLIDEISKFKAAGGATLKALRKVAKHFKWRAGLSATPVAENAQDIYAQMLLIDLGKALGTRKDKFLTTYFYPTDYMQYNWEPLPDGLARLTAALGNHIFVADAGQYDTDLPELIEDTRWVRLPEQAQLNYDKMLKDGLLLNGAITVEAANAAVVTGKLQQIAAGAVYDDTGVPYWQHRCKFIALESLLLAADGPVLVAYQYDFEKPELRLAGVELFDGSVEMMSLWNAGRIKAMGIHPKSASHGLNLQYGGHELICMSPFWSADQWAQLLGRLRRRGQPSPFVRRTTIVARSTVDWLVLEKLAGKADYEQAFMDHLKKRTR